MNAGRFRPDNDEFAEWAWSEITNSWIELSFALVRHWRESLNTPRFLTAMERLREPVKQKVDWQSRWYYEYSLFFLAQGDFPRVRQFVRDWETSSAPPFWKTRKAAVEAETGDSDGALGLAEEALITIRSSTNPG